MWSYNYTPNQNDIMHYGVLGMKWGVRKVRKWASSKNQPSSVKSRLLTGAYAATKSKKIGNALDKSNAKDGENWEKAKSTYSEYLRRQKKYKLTNTDKALYGTRGAKRIAERKARGDSVSIAQAKELGRQVVQGLLLSAIATTTIYSIASGKVSQLASKGKKAAKAFIDSQYKTSILDASGNVIKRYRESAVKDVITNIVRR